MPPPYAYYGYAYYGYAYYGYAYYGNLYLLWLCLLWQSILTMARLVRRRLSGLIVAAHRGTIRIQSDVRLWIVSIAASVSVAIVSIALWAVVRESPETRS